MVYKINLNTVIGELVGYRPRLHPLTMLAHVLVKVNNKIIKIPIDYRQVHFVQKEYPIGSNVELEFNGQWKIRSRQAPIDQDINNVVSDAF